MATTTPRIGLTKPDGTDLVDIAVLNTNFDKIDSNIASTKIQSTKPTTANAGDLWWDSDTGTLYLYYVDANSAQWVAATSDPINIGVVASQAERDAQYPTPAQGMSVYRTDLGVTQRYYGLFNSSTNPGGRDSAGWYDTEKTAGLIPIQPTSVGIASGTGNATAMGRISFANATAVQFNGVFTSKYRSYRIIFSHIYFNTPGSELYVRMRKAGTDTTGSVYDTHGVSQVGTGSPTAYYASSSSVATMGRFAFDGSAVLDIHNPQIAARTSFENMASGWTSNNGYYSTVSLCDDFLQYDGISFIPSSGNFNGEVIIMSYNY